MSDLYFHVANPKNLVLSIYIIAAIVVNTSTYETVEEKIDIDSLMAMGELAVVEKVFKKCAACH